MTRLTSTARLGVGQVVPRMWPVDQYPYKLLGCDGVYHYGAAGSAVGTVVRVNVATDAVDTPYTFNLGGTTTIDSINVTSTPGLIFADVWSSVDSKHILYRSADYGVTWTSVMLLGDFDGTSLNQIPAVSLLVTKGFCELIDKRIVVGEYNVNGSIARTPSAMTTDGATVTVTVANTYQVGETVTIAGCTPAGFNATATVASVIGTPGAATGFTYANATAGPITVIGTVTAPRTNGKASGSNGDAVRIMQSADRGLTWTQLSKFNADGSNNNVQHVHCIRQDPYTGNVWFGFGDSTAQAMILRWDGSSTWLTNTSPSGWGSQPGFKVGFGTSNIQRWRVLDLLFDATYAYGFGDSSGQDRGIWRYDKSTFEARLVDSQISTLDGSGTVQAGWFGVKTSSGLMLFATQCPATQTNTAYYIFASWTGQDWTVIGQWSTWNDTSGSKLPRAFYEFGGKLYFTGDRPCGLSSSSDFATGVYTMQGQFQNERPDQLMPLRFVNPTTGLDTNDGKRPSTAWKTLNVMDTGVIANITWGQRVMVSPGNMALTNGMTPSFAAASGMVGKSGDPLQITGAGRGVTNIRLPDQNDATGSGGTRLNFISLNVANYYVVIENLSAVNEQLSQGTMYNSNNVGGTKFTLRDADWGSVAATHVHHGFFMRQDTIKCYRSRIMSSKDQTANKNLVHSAAATNDFKAVGCVFHGGRRTVLHNFGDTLEFDHCLLKGWLDTLNAAIVNTVTTSTVAIKFRNSVIYSTNGSAVPITDNASLTWSTDHVRNSVFVTAAASPATVITNGKNNVQNASLTQQFTSLSATAVATDDYHVLSTGTQLRALGERPSSGLVNFDYYGAPFFPDATIGPAEYLPGGRATA